jgi:hypothetical protein
MFTTGCLTFVRRCAILLPAGPWGRQSMLKKTLVVVLKIIAGILILYYAPHSMAY